MYKYNLFFCTTNFCLCRAELRCEEVALSKTEIEGGFGGHTRRTRIRNSFGRYWLSDVPPSQRVDIIRKAVADSLQQHGYIWFFSIIITMIVLSPISSRCIVKLYSRQKQVFVYMYLYNYNYNYNQLHPCAGQYWCKRGTARDWQRTTDASPRSFRNSTCCGQWCSVLQHRRPAKQPGGWSTRRSNGISGGRILTSSVWAGSFCPCTRTVRCTAPRSFPRQSS